jgi:hypothetical protein
MRLVSRFVVASSFAIASAFFAGCGAGAPVSGAALEMPSVGGLIHGGVNPVQNAAVRLYETQTTGVDSNFTGTSGYGTAGKLLGTATSGSVGEFTIAPVGGVAYTCDSSEYVYITSTGGNTGGSQATNQNVVMMAALGSCSNFTTGKRGNVQIYMSEVSTAAAAYALGNFISITNASGSPYSSSNVADGAQIVNVGAPQSNATPSGACTGTVGTPNSMTCKANGLGHAFTTAYNLVDAVNYASVLPSGKVRTTLPTNADASVPTALLNLIGNIEQDCVNTGGGVSGDGSACGEFFLDTTSPDGTSVPTNNLQAVMNMAKTPTQNVADLTGLAAQISFFSPSLTSTPPDFSLGIVYTGISYGTTTTAFIAPEYLVLDAQDIAYIVESKTGGGGAFSAMNPDGSSPYAPTTYAGQTPEAMAADYSGNIWIANLSSVGKIYRLTASTGAQSTTITTSSYPEGVQVDRAGNVWVARQASGGSSQNLFSYNASSSFAGTSFTHPPEYKTGPIQLSIDGAQNIWSMNTYQSSTGTATASQVGYFANSTSGTTLSDAAASYKYYYGAATLNELSGNGVANDSTGNAYAATAAGLYKVPSGATPSTSATFTITPTEPLLWSSVNALKNFAIAPNSINTDGANAVYIPLADTGTNAVDYVVQYDTAAVPGVAAAGAYQLLSPCYAPAGAKTCAVDISIPSVAQADSAGDVWVVNNNTSLPYVTEIVGTAAPTWPALQYSKPGALPQ